MSLFHHPHHESHLHILFIYCLFFLTTSSLLVVVIASSTPTTTTTTTTKTTTSTKTNSTIKRNLATYETCWEQIGTDITGDNFQNAMGASVHLVSSSPDTYTVAAGAYGYVKVYTYNTTSNDDEEEEDWELVGERIDGTQDYNEFGASVKLSSNGRILAVGAPYHNNGIGHVRVFHYNNTDWIPMGDEIDGQFPNEQFGQTLSLSSDGTRVVVGNLYKTQGLTRTRVYSYITVVNTTTTTNATEGKWEQLGSDIMGLTAGDSMGYSTAMTNDGNIIAVGAPDSAEGYVQIWRWNDTSTQWIQMGQNLNGINRNDKFGSSIALSSTGSILTVGARFHKGPNGIASGHVQVFTYHPSNNTWQPYGLNYLDGEARVDYSGYAISSSSNGQTVAVGGWSNDANGKDSGHVRVWKYVNDTTTSWIPQGHDIDGENPGDASGSSVSLSSDGEVLAIGARRHGLYSTGHVRVWGETKVGCVITLTPSGSPSVRPTATPSLGPTRVPSVAPSRMKQNNRNKLVDDNGGGSSTQWVVYGNVCVVASTSLWMILCTLWL